MNDATSHFRGYHSIKEIVDYMEPLGEWMKKYKPDSRELTLKGPDFDLIKRWPKAASMFHIRQNEAGELSWDVFRLKRDKKPPRYDKKAGA